MTTKSAPEDDFDPMLNTSKKPEEVSPNGSYQEKTPTKIINNQWAIRSKPRLRELEIDQTLSS
jgi:hypothetical protein